VLIKIDDKVNVNQRTANFREGIITDISIATMSGDPAGELGVQIQEYDTELNYNGSIGYVTENGDQYWAYFSQILKDI
tara:strand:- start:474 stop:707 length:234 start_codon:yes stop_codon:yes gene_type:complete